MNFGQPKPNETIERESVCVRERRERESKGEIKVVMFKKVGGREREKGVHRTNLLLRERGWRESIGLQ